MRKEDRYKLRAEKVPYYFDEIVTRGAPTNVGSYPGVSTKMYEIFDGNEVKWGIREEFISIFDSKVCKSTPLFENMTDSLGNDKERVIYLGDSKFVYHGKINGSEVLCKENNSLETDEYYKIEDFSGQDVKIFPNNKETVFAIFKQDGLSRCRYFDLNEFCPCSNIFDIVDTSHYFLKSYTLNGKVRLFLGQTNEDGRVIYPYGFDFAKNEYILFPLDEKGLIDEELMMDYVYKGSDLGLDFDYYSFTQVFIKGLMSLGVYAADARRVLQELNKGNVLKIRK